MSLLLMGELSIALLCQHSHAEDASEDFPAGESVEAVMAKSRREQATLEPTFRIWPFGKKKRPPSESKIVNVGPRETPASAGSLLRVLQPVSLPGVILSAGFYEARYLPGPMLSIFQRQTELIQLKLLTRDASSSEQSPLRSTSNATARDKAFLEVSEHPPDQVRFILERVDGTHWQTEWFPVGGQNIQGF